MQRSLFCLVALVLAAPLAPTGVGAAMSDEITLGEHMAAMLRAGRSVVSKNQALINDPNKGDKGIDGDSLIRDAVAIYTARMGAPPMADTLPEPERHLMQALMDSMREIVDEHEAEIDTPGLGFKGFIPAVYGRLVGERFEEKVGTEALLKVTAPENLVRNRKALPDDWEKMVIDTHFLSPDWTKGESYTEQAEVHGRPAFRMLMPEYYDASCLTCHGKPAGELDVTGYPKEGASEGDLGGAISITLFE